MLRVTDPDVPKVLVFHDITALWGQEGVTWEQSPRALQPPPHLGPQHSPCSPLVLAPRRPLSPAQPHVPTSAPTQLAQERPWPCSTRRVARWDGAAAPSPAQPAASLLVQPLGFRPSLQRPSRLRGRSLPNNAVSQCPCNPQHPSNPQHQALLSLPPGPRRKRVSFHESNGAQLSPPFPRSGEQLAPSDALAAPHRFATARLAPPAPCGAGRDACGPCLFTPLHHHPPLPVPGGAQRAARARLPMALVRPRHRSGELGAHRRAAPART